MSVLLAKRQQPLIAYLQGTLSLDEGIHTIAFLPQPSNI
jgi:hypothetical protein